MDLKEQMRLLYSLQQADSELDLLKKQFGAIDIGLAEQARVETAAAAQKETSVHLKGLTAMLHDLELEIQGLATKRAEVETKLYSGSITNAKELQAMEAEIAMFDRQRTTLDEKVASLQEEKEAAAASEAITKKALSVARAALKAKVTAARELASQMSGQAQKLSQRRNQREEEARAASPSLLKRYQAIRNNRSGIGVVVIEDGNACGGCKLGLPSSCVAAVRDGFAPQVCDNCGRLLCEAAVAVVS